MAFLTPFQKTIHYPENLNLGPTHPGNRVRSEFYSENRRATWFFRTPERLECSYENDILIAKPNLNHSGLLSTDLTLHLPSIKCKNGYKAKWIHNVGFEYIQECQLHFDEDIVQSFDTKWIELYHQAFTKQSSDLTLGNIESLQNFYTNLPSYECNITLPWFYSQDYPQFFPLYLCGTLNNVQHRIRMNREIHRYLQCIRDSDNSMVSIEEAIELMDDKPITDLLEVPTMWGEYIDLSDIELDYRRNDESFTQFLYTDIVSNNSTLCKQSKFEMKIQCPYPVNGLGWILQQNGTNVSPKSSSLLIPNRTIFEQLPSYRTEKLYPSRHFISIPRQNGYNFWFMGTNVASLNPQPGIVLHNGTFCVVIDSLNSVDCFVRLMITKRLSFTQYPKTNQEQKEFKSRIKIEG